MPITLHAAFVPGALQMLGTVQRLVQSAKTWGDETGISHADILKARLHPDMLPFAYQVKSVAVHSAGALAGLEIGVFSPDLDPPPQDFVGLHDRLEAAIGALLACDEAVLDARIGTPMRFAFGDFAMDFLAEDFLLSFSQPNCYFHASTAYGILRHLGMPIGKRDFLGRLRILR